MAALQAQNKTRRPLPRPMLGGMSGSNTSRNITHKEIESKEDSTVMFYLIPVFIAAFVLLFCCIIYYFWKRHQEQTTRERRLIVERMARRRNRLPNVVYRTNENNTSEAIIIYREPIEDVPPTEDVWDVPPTEHVWDAPPSYDEAVCNSSIYVQAVPDSPPPPYPGLSGLSFENWNRFCPSLSSSESSLAPQCSACNDTEMQIIRSSAQVSNFRSN